MIKKSFPLRVLAVSFIVLALPILIDSFVFFQNTYEESIKQSKQELREITNYRAFSIIELEPIKQVLLKELSYLLDLPARIGKLPNKKMQEELEGIRDLWGQYTIFILGLSKDANYQIIGTSNPKFLSTNFLSYIQLSEVLKRGEGDFFRYIYSSEKKQLVPVLFIARTIYSADGKQLGILMIASDVEEQIKPLLEKAGKNKEIRFALIDQEGIVFAASDPKFERQTFLPISQIRKQQIIASGQFGDYPFPEKPLTIIREEGGSFFQFLFEGKIQIAYKASSPRVGISLVAYSPKGAIFGTSIRHFVIIYSIYGLILIIGGGITYWLTLWMSRPLRQLSHLMGKVSEGDYEVRFQEEPFGFEINHLGNIFNQTLGALLENIHKAEDERVMKETYRKELKMGQEAQRNLFPEELAVFPGIEIAEGYISPQEVGGDFYDVYVRPCKKQEGLRELVLTISDAAGKGVTSCIYSLGVRSLLRAYASLYEDVAEIMQHTNSLFLIDTGDTGMFVTVFMAIYHPGEKKLYYYSCGHVPAIVRRANGHLVTLSHTGMAMGLRELKDIHSDSVDLFPGDIVLFYTDGLTEAMNDKDQRFTLRRLQTLLQQRDWKTAREVADGLTSEVSLFMGGAVQQDDITILVMKVES